jgi:integrase
MDLGNLPKKALDLDRGWLNYPRPKTGVDRRIPLWPETVEALKVAIALRKRARKRADEDQVFLNGWGSRWGEPVTKYTGAAMNYRGTTITVLFSRLLKRLGIYRRGLGFYSCRRLCETIGGGSRDQVAVNAIMGHVDTTMAGEYREHVEDARLRAVTDHIRAWLFTVESPAVLPFAAGG